MHDLAFFPGWMRATHLINIIFISFLMRSGLQILAAFPRLYWTDNCRPGIEWLRLTRHRVPPEDPDAIYASAAHTEQAAYRPTAPALPERGTLLRLALWALRWLVYRGRRRAHRSGEHMSRAPRIYTSLEEELDVSPWMALPGHKQLGLGRHWHFFCDVIWILNGIVFLAFMIATGYWRYLVPTSWSIVPDALQSAWTYLHLRLAPPLPGQPFNALQKLSYFFVICILAPFQIATAAAMSPAVAARFPWYIKLFGGRQAARSLHFLSLLAFVAFVIVHTLMVILHNFGREMGTIIWGRPEHVALSVGIGVVAFAGIVGLHAAATRVSLRHPRATQRALGWVTGVLIQQMLFGWEGSRQEYARSAISPYFWVNGHPPVEDTYLAMVREQFAGWQLEVCGLVEQPLRLSLDDLRAMPKQTQITMHNCIQGWSDVAEWGGVQLRHIIERCTPRPEARYVVFHAMDDKDTSETRAEGHGYFYGTIDMRLARHHQTILAYEMNGAPLPVPHGAPLRLRVETQLGFKMVKWLRAIEFVADFHDVGQGMGGWREDYQHYDTGAGI